MFPRPWCWEQVAAHNAEGDCWVIIEVGGGRCNMGEPTRILPFFTLNPRFFRYMSSYDVTHHTFTRNPRFLNCTSPYHVIHHIFTL